MENIYSTAPVKCKKSTTKICTFHNDINKHVLTYRISPQARHRINYISLQYDFKKAKIHER